MKRKVILLIYLVAFLLFLCGCSNTESTEKIDIKIQSELEYLDKELIEIMNKLNNISLENYEIQSKVIKAQNDKESGKQESSGENSSSSENGNSSQGDSSSESNKDIKVLQMQPSNILVIDKNDVDWLTIKSKTEVMYSTWNTILLDLYAKNISNDEILNFGRDLDNTIILIKSEDKQGSLKALANLYSYLPRFAKKLQIEESTKNILQTKSNILNAYALVEEENWEEIESELNKANDAYVKVANDANFIQSNSQKVGSTYVLIKELKNSINLQDKDVFYIKYKNLMNSIK